MVKKSCSNLDTRSKSYGFAALFFCSFFPMFALAYVTSPATNSADMAYTVSWTNSGASAGCGYGGATFYAYILTETIVGTSISTVLSFYGEKSFTFVGKSPGTYSYELTYRTCNSSGAAYYSAGTTTTIVLLPPPPSGGRKVEYIHSDLLGSPAATSDEQGKVNE